MGEDGRRKQWEMVRNIDSSATRVNVSMRVNWTIYRTAYRQENIKLNVFHTEVLSKAILGDYM